MTTRADRVFSIGCKVFRLAEGSSGASVKASEGNRSCLSSVKETGPRKFTHRFIFFGLFFIFFAAFSIPYWTLMREVLPRSISLANESAWFSPALAFGTSVDYAGFVLPLMFSIASLLLYARLEGPKTPLPRSVKILVVIIPIAFALSQFTSLGIFASVGLSDPISLTVLVIASYNVTFGRPVKQVALLSYPLGFAVGFLSDFESASYFHGVFGGYGLGDGDFIFPLGFLVTAVVFSKVWKPSFSALLGLEARADRWIQRRPVRVSPRGRTCE